MWTNPVRLPLDLENVMFELGIILNLGRCLEERTLVWV